ncbi:MAG: LysR substrate-binding domain-containing protein, partial [Anaerovoracaceae bacterium]
FQRNRKPLVLSKEGQEYLDYFNAQNELERKFRRSVADMRDLRKGTLRIGGTSLYTTVVLPKAVKKFNEKYPGIDVSICNGSVMELAEQAGKRSIDLYISSPGKKAKGIEYKPLADMETVVCVPEELAQKAGLEEEGKIDFDSTDWTKGLPYADMAKMADIPFAVLKGNQQMGMMLDKLFRKYGADPKHPIMTDQALTAYSLTAEGAAASLMYDRIVRRLPVTEGIRFYRIDDEAARGPLYAAYPVEEEVPLAVVEFLKCFRETIA